MTVRILIGDCREKLRELSDASVHCCVTSPPYFGLRDYGHAGQMGLEPTPDEYVAGMVEVFREVRRCLRDDGVLFLNIGDSYAGSWGARGRSDDTNAARPDLEAKHGTEAPARNGFPGVKPKDLIGIPWLLAFALRADGWYLRQEIIWHKPNPMPESVRDRCTKAHEQIFLLSKSPRYFFDAEAISEPAAWERWGDQTELKSHTGTAGHLGGKTLAELPIKDTKNKRSVWTVATQPYSEAHFATYPPALIEPCILAGCPTKCCSVCAAPYTPLYANFPEKGVLPSCRCNAPCMGGTVLDPFGGAGTTGLVADRLGRNAILVELNPEYAEIARNRLSSDGGMFADVKVAA